MIMILVENLEVISIRLIQKDPKKNWIPNVKNLKYDANMLETSNLKYHINSGCLNHMIGDINMLFYSYDRRSFFL